VSVAVAVVLVADVVLPAGIDQAAQVEDLQRGEVDFLAVAVEAAEVVAVVEPEGEGVEGSFVVAACMPQEVKEEALANEKEEGVEESARGTMMPGVAREGAPASEATVEVAEELVVSRCEGRVAEVVGRRRAGPKPERVGEVAGSFVVAVVPCRRRDHKQSDDKRCPLDEGPRAKEVPRRPLLYAKARKLNFA